MREEFTRISLCPYRASSPHLLMPCLLTDQNFTTTIFEKGHSRNISMKLFQNLTSSFREDDFLGICSCSYSESSPHKPERSKFRQPFLRKVTPVEWGLEATYSVALIDKILLLN